MSAAIPASAHQIWEATLSQLLLRVTRQNYDTWLRSTYGERYDGTTLVVKAANDLACDWLSTRMKNVIAQALTVAAGPGLAVRFEPSEAEIHADATTPLQPQLIQNPRTPLNPRYTFRTFMEAAFNRLALAAIRDVTQSCETRYSPLFIAAASGMGKTHLLHAAALEAGDCGQQVLLVSAEQFLSEFTTALRQKTGAAFRARYREPDLLLVDDVHTLMGKKATLNEFYQTLAGLSDQGRRVVVAGDPSAMSAEASRFQGMLRWGLVANIETPEADERIQFIEMKAVSQGLQLPLEVQQYIALRVRSSIRDLEGAVNRVNALLQISDEPLSVDFVVKALQPVTISHEEKHGVAPTELIEAVARHLSLPPEEITGQKRARALTYARHVAMYLLRHDADMTYAAIAGLMNKKDHSTVVHACSQLNHQLTLSPELRADIDAIRADLHIPTDAA